MLLDSIQPQNYYKIQYTILFFDKMQIKVDENEILAGRRQKTAKDKDADLYQITLFPFWI